MDLGAVLGAALSAGSVAVARYAHELWGERALHAALAWLDEPQAEARTLGEVWRTILRSRSIDTMAWFKAEGRPLRTDTLRLLPEVTNPRDPVLDGVPTSRLAEWARRVSQEPESRADTDVLALLLAIGLRREDEGACDLVVAAFPRVHESLLRSGLSWRAWGWLEPLMPSKDWFFSLDWDKADKLRRALFVRFTENDWPARNLRHAAHDEQARRYLRKTATTTGPWERIAREGMG